MRPGGIRGTRDTLVTGRVFIDSIPTGSTTGLVAVITKFFITSTIAARAPVGTKGFMTVTTVVHIARIVIAVDIARIMIVIATVDDITKYSGSKIGLR
jgi:hypothetical protein